MKDDTNRSLRHVSRKAGDPEDRTVVVDSSAFFSETPPSPPRPPKRPSSSTPPRSGRRTPPPSGPSAGGAAAVPSKWGKILLGLQGILSAAALIQLWRTQMLPALYLIILAALLALLWLLVKRCQEYNVPGRPCRAHCTPDSV